MNILKSIKNAIDSLYGEPNSEMSFIVNDKNESNTQLRPTGYLVSGKHPFKRTHVIKLDRLPEQFMKAAQSVLHPNLTNMYGEPNSELAFLVHGENDGSTGLKHHIVVRDLENIGPWSMTCGTPKGRFADKAINTESK